MDIPANYFQYHPNAAKFNTPGGLISSLLPNILVIAGLVLLLIIIYSGFNLLSDAGLPETSPNLQRFANHRNALTYGILGFLIVISAYFILQIVGFSTGVDFTHLGSLNLF